MSNIDDHKFAKFSKPTCKHIRNRLNPLYCGKCGVKVPEGVDTVNYMIEKEGDSSSV